jgi:hypothetical protein
MGVVQIFKPKISPNHIFLLFKRKNVKYIHISLKIYFFEFCFSKLGNLIICINV